MKKTLLLLLAAGMIASVAVACAGPDVGSEIGAVGAEDTIGIVPLPDVIDEDEVPEDDAIINDGSDITFDDINIVLPGEGGGFGLDGNIPEYFHVTGEITSIEVIDGVSNVLINDTDGNEAVLMIDADTVFPFADTFEVGDVVTGWYLTNAPMRMIYPPHYSTAILAAGVPDGVNIRADRFNSWTENTQEGFMLSSDEMFAFRTDENTEIVLEDGQDFSRGDLENRRIIVIYGISTRSIPEQATADKLIVLFENIMALG